MGYSMVTRVLTFILVQFPACLPNQFVHSGIGIESAIRSLGRKAVGIEYQVKDVRVLVSANPAQRINLKLAARDIRKKSCRFKTANIEDNAHLGQLLLKNRRHQPRTLFRGRFHREMETDAILRRITGFIQQVPGPCRIVVIADRIAVIGPTLGW